MVLSSIFERRSTEEKKIIPLKNVVSCELKKMQFKKGATITIKHFQDEEERTIKCNAITPKNALEIEARINYAIVHLY